MSSYDFPSLQQNIALATAGFNKTSLVMGSIGRPELVPGLMNRVFTYAIKLEAFEIFVHKSISLVKAFFVVAVIVCPACSHWKCASSARH